MKRSCKTLQNNEQVVFMCYSDIYNKKIPEIGTVVYVYNDKVCISWMDSYKERHTDVDFTDMLAVYNPNGEYMTFEHISGPSDLLEP